MNKRFAIVVIGLLSTVGSQAAIDVDPGQLPGSFLSLVGSGPGQNVFGGSVYDPPNSVFSGSNIVGAIPKDVPSNEFTVGKWLAAGPSHTDPAVLKFGSGVTAVSFFWGSPDSYNSFAVDTLVGGLQPLILATVASDASVTLNQNQDRAYYVTFKAAAGDSIKSITFGSSGLGAPGTNAIEISNVTVVPEPEAYGLALAGMGVVAFAMRRRRPA